MFRAFQMPTLFILFEIFKPDKILLTQFEGLITLRLPFEPKFCPRYFSPFYPILKIYLGLRIISSPSYGPRIALCMSGSPGSLEERLLSMIQKNEFKWGLCFHTFLIHYLIERSFTAAHSSYTCLSVGTGKTFSSQINEETLQAHGMLTMGISEKKVRGKVKGNNKGSENSGSKKGSSKT